MYSSIKVNGKKLYEYARKGKILEVPPRDIEIYDIVLNKFNKDEIEFKVECSKGTYIRTLCEEIAKRLGTIGCMKELDRIQVGQFNKKDAIKIEELKENKDNIEFAKRNFITFEDVLKDKPSIELDEIEMRKFLNGVKIQTKLQNGVYRIFTNNKFIGTGVVNNNSLKRDIVL